MGVENQNFWGGVDVGVRRREGWGSRHPEEEGGAGVCQVSVGNDEHKGRFGCSHECHGIGWSIVRGQ